MFFNDFFFLKNHTQLFIFKMNKLLMQDHELQNFCIVNIQQKTRFMEIVLEALIGGILHRAKRINLCSQRTLTLSARVLIS